MLVNLARDIQEDSIVDGEGIRAVIWAQGCSHNCKGCHNPQSHDFNAGTKVDVEEVKSKIANLKNHDGITLSGGDPLFQPEQFAEIASFAKSINLNVWCYTGFEFEQLQKMAKQNNLIKNLLENIDVLVDGKFILEQKSLNLYFRGSKNQRILDLQKSLKLGFAFEIEKYKEEKKFEKYSHSKNEENGLFV